MLSNLNIESYITERLNTGKKYNLVRLNNKWYILDIDEGYILVGYNTADFKPDTYSNNIIVSKYNYILESYDLDYNDIKKLIIKEDKKEETKKEVKDNDTNEYTGLNIKDFNTLIEWILLIVSLCVIILVVKHYTR
jgi:hypothetical protein